MSHPDCRWPDCRCDAIGGHWCVAAVQAQAAQRAEQTRPYAAPDHPGNRLRPHVRCIGCKKLGCTTAWGPWCFKCNVERIDRISANLDAEARRRGIAI